MKAKVYKRSRKIWSERDALLDILSVQNIKEEQLRAEHDENHYVWRVKKEESSNGILGFIVISVLLTIGGNLVINYFKDENIIENVTTSFEEVDLEEFKTDFKGLSIGTSDYKIIDVVIKKTDEDVVEGFFVIENENNEDSFYFVRDFQVSTNKLKGGEGFFNLRDDINQETLQNKVLSKYTESHIFTIPEIVNDINYDETFEFRFLKNNTLIFYNDNRQYEGTYSFTEIKSSDNANKELDFTNKGSLTNEDIENFLNTDSFSCMGKMKLKFKNDGVEKEIVANFATIEYGFLLKNGRLRIISDGSFHEFLDLQLVVVDRAPAEAPASLR
jgi:hypothetical protein